MDTAPKFTITDTPSPPKRKPGRPPGSTNKPAATRETVTAAEVSKAMAVLESSYNLITTGLVIAGLRGTATAWVESAEELNKTNKDALTASPKVVKAIIRSGDVGGSLTFFITHGMAFAGLFRAANTELANRRAEREKEQRETYTPPTQVDIVEQDKDPAFIPGM